MSEETERADFENAMRDRPGATGMRFERYPGGQYLSRQAADAWEGWQAARSILSQHMAGMSEETTERIWIDCEFNEHAGRHELISMALVADDGREWYEVLWCHNPGPWVAENVMPKLGKFPITREAFAESLREFLAPYKAVHIIADWPSDIALFCDALIVSAGCRIDTPPLTLEVIRLDGESAEPHNALADARGIRDIHRVALSPPPDDQMAVNARRYRFLLGYYLDHGKFPSYPIIGLCDDMHLMDARIDAAMKETP